jgi:hypothetical protein
MEWPRAEDLLAGPRGRRLCWSLLEPGDYPGWDLVWDGAQQGSLTGLTAELAACVARTDLESTVVRADQLTLLAALVEPVQTAMYWQEPDVDDYALSAPVDGHRRRSRHLANRDCRGRAVSPHAAGRPAVPWTGHWWSAPVPSRIPSTTRSIPGLGAVGLALVEDGFGQRNARCWPLAPRPGARIYEISCPADWAELVGR